MQRAIAVTADVLVLVLAAVVLLIIITGGGVFVVGGRRVSVMGVDNPLVALSLIAALRYTALRRAPLFGIERWSPSAIEGWARSRVIAFQRWIETLRPGSAVAAIAAAVAIATVLKLVLAWAYPGFFSGDDVEVHEMSVGMLWNVRWPIWDLRNAAFPVGVVYPMQKLFASMGANDPASLVFAGRAAVAAISSLAIVLVWRAGVHLWPSAPGWGVIAAVLFATTHLHIAFGSSELPRPVATVFVVGAFVLLQQPRIPRVMMAAVLLAIAASLRFSEAMFLAPAVAMLAWERRWLSGLLLVFAAAAIFLGILAASDVWFWGEPLHSLNAAIDYTLVQRLSSRGYQNPLWYLTNILAWLNPALVVLAAIALVVARRAIDVWIWLPLLLLSLLPHKEARYMIPVVPFVCLTAVRGLQIVTARIASDPQSARHSWTPLALTGVLCIGLLYDAGHWRLPRANADVVFARRLDGAVPGDSRVAIEQAWRAGGRLYLHPREVLDLDPDRLGDARYLWETVPPDATIVLDNRTATRHGLTGVLQSHGYETRELGVTGSRYELWMPPQHARRKPE